MTDRAGNGPDTPPPEPGSEGDAGGTGSDGTPAGERDAESGDRDAESGDRDAAAGNPDAEGGERNAERTDRDAERADRDAERADRDAERSDRDTERSDRLTGSRDPDALLRRAGVRPDRRRDQHFLVDDRVLDRLPTYATEAGFDLGHVLEIGAGTGALTDRLLAVADRVTAVERDPDLAAFLRAEFAAHVADDATSEDAIRDDATSDDAIRDDATSDDAIRDNATSEDAIRDDATSEDAIRDDATREDAVRDDEPTPDRESTSDGRLAVVEGDALEVALPEYTACVSNLPYGVSSEILFRLLPRRRPLVVMLQREFAERMAADPGTDDYGRLSVTAGHYAEVEIVEPVPPEAFRPPPAVESAVVRTTPRKPEYVSAGEATSDDGDDAFDETFFLRFVKALFTQRRKTVRNAVRNTAHIAGLADPEAVVEAADGDLLDRRPEDLAPAEFAALARLAADAGAVDG